ncbi:F-box/kelch-repeat protein At3g61590 [Cicer arietinum]|uniref:F-box/kelch-repeat protein At3g61590 n=1 Tax=Cicer arietinum TaxID=3827 RepID=A0A1S2XUM3_CICAR|nr:F-box/kelch-repeat protein At3g61590 [Cicer arietinum]
MSYHHSSLIVETEKFDSFSIHDEEATTIDVNAKLPEDLLALILSYLPIPCIFRAGCVCTSWHRIVNSKRFLWNLSDQPLPKKPWYFMFKSSNDSTGYAFDPDFKKWYDISLPSINTSTWSIASSYGMICFMDNNRSNVFVCNPITKSYKKLVKPTGLEHFDYTALSISVNKESHSYIVAIVKSKHVDEDYSQYDTSVYLYDSEKVTWVMALTDVLIGWRVGEVSVICDGVLYFLVYSTRIGAVENRHSLVAYDMSNDSSQCSLTTGLISIPYSLTCGRLMNLKEKLVMVGGISKQGYPEIVKEIVILVLNGDEWEEIARMPRKYLESFREFDDVFACSGADDLIYIQSYGDPKLLMYDMNLRQWKWSQKYPVTKRLHLQTFTGFCFEPRLEVDP